MYTIVAPIPENLETALTPYRQKYDPVAEVLPAGIIILKPFDFSRSGELLYEHLQEVGEQQAPIKVSLAGWDIYQQKNFLLALPLIAGYQEFMNLRQHILTGPLSPLAKQDDAYRPEIIFGRFSTQPTVDRARQALKGFEPQFVFSVAHMDLLQRDKLDEPWTQEQRFGLKGTVSSLPRIRNSVREDRQ